jgi:acyl-CoA synthetase (AMP-forming)/AMP-acid ligase II
MTDVEALPETAASARLNVTDRLTAFAQSMPNAIAVACPRRASPRAHGAWQGKSGAGYATITFAELDAEASRIAQGLSDWGVPPGTRLALLVRPGIEFVALVFGLLRAGIIIVLVDPGLGRRNLVRCLSEAKPAGFVAISVAQAVRTCLRLKFPQAQWNVTVGRRWFWGGLTLDQLRQRGDAARSVPATTADDPAAIIFTSGSTGAPKGVLYTQRMFDTQVSEIQAAYGIEASGTDLACFPLFALFNSAMGVTTVLPEMNFARPASADPKKLLQAANDWQVTQAFGSPAVWRMLSAHCAKTGERIPSLRQVFSCGAPVTADVLRATLACVAPGAKMHTPYGMTEALPVATIEAAEVLGETASRTDEGAGVCVGRKFDSIDRRVIRISDEPIARIEDAEELPSGEIGELVVRGPQVSPVYVTRPEANATAKIGGVPEYLVQSTKANSNASLPPSPFPPPPSVWHRTGDVGYLDDAGRFWYCGRKSQRVTTRNGALFTEKCEGVFNSLPGVRRSALVGVGPNGMQLPVMVVEPLERSIAGANRDSRRRQDELINSWHDIEPRLEKLWYAEHGFVPLERILFHPALPVDIRHNAKINREWLAAWAAKQIGTVATRKVGPLSSRTESARADVPSGNKG